MEFKPFPKLARLNREIVITEKLDGTNAQVWITDLAAVTNVLAEDVEPLILAQQGTLLMFAGSRTKWVTPGKQTDNYGFAAWVKENAEELFQLGPGQHFGEWWGGKIQRGYGLTEKRFSLFNTGRWVEDQGGFFPPIGENQQYAPACCHVVPVLYQGPFEQHMIRVTLKSLQEFGSIAAPGFMRPEGIVIYHSAANIQFKVTLEKDESPKSLARVA